MGFMFRVVFICGMGLFIFGRDEEIFADHKEERNRGYTDEKLISMHLFNDELTGDGERKDLHDRIQGLVEHHIDQLNGNDDIDDVLKKSDQALGIYVRAADQLLRETEKSKHDSDDDRDRDKRVEEFQHSVDVFFKESVDRLLFRIIHEGLLAVGGKSVIHCNCLAPGITCRYKYKTILP